MADQIRGVRDRLDALGSVLGPTNAVSGDLDERLLVAQSADFRTARQRDPYLEGVQKAIDEQLGGIEMPQDRSITLTARRGEIPVTFQNHTGHPVKVVVRMESDKLDFPGGETLEIDLTRLNTTHRFPVVARHVGRLPHPHHPGVARRAPGGGPGPAHRALDGGVGRRAWGSPWGRPSSSPCGGDATPNGAGGPSG